jgi:hypothetical protein
MFNKGLPKLLSGSSIHTPKLKLGSRFKACFVYTKNEVCTPLQNDICRYFMIGHVFLQQHTGLDSIVGSPMFTNKDLFFVNKADPSVRAELYVWGFEPFD